MASSRAVSGDDPKKRKKNFPQFSNYSIYFYCIVEKLSHQKGLAFRSAVSSIVRVFNLLLVYEGLYKRTLLDGFLRTGIKLLTEDSFEFGTQQFLSPSINDSKLHRGLTLSKYFILKANLVRYSLRL